MSNFIEGNVDVVKLLLDHGGYVNAKDIRGETPLHDAVHRNIISFISPNIGKEFNLFINIHLRQFGNG